MMATTTHEYDGPKKSAGAKRVYRLAKEFNLPLPEDAAVVAALARLDAADTIPSELFALVADVLAFVHRTDVAIGADRG